MSVKLVPETVSRGKAARAMKVTTHLLLMPRLRMSGAVGLRSVHRDNFTCSFHSLSCQDYVVVMAAEVLKVVIFLHFFLLYVCFNSVVV